ncbi:MAG: response regulator transcription factor [Hyphomicrobiales bacterium]|nr:response regulator transcription factor [Hyphomicrobiales bacterium]
MRVLIAEDKQSLAGAMVQAFRRKGYAVDTFADGEEVEAALCGVHYDVLILDLGLPRLDGLEILRGLRHRGSRTAVLILTARDALEDRIKGLDLGADDYMTKPFELAELEARVRALIRRQTDQRAAIRKIGGLSFDTVNRTADIDGRPVRLPPRELSLLEALISRTGHVVPKERLAESLTDFDDDLSPSAVELYVSRLRKRVDPAGLRIRTIRGLGYILEAPT